MIGIPLTLETDAEDVAWALQTADALWKRSERVDAIVWLRRAAQAAGDAEDDDRALTLARDAAELAEWIETGAGGGSSGEAAPVSGDIPVDEDVDDPEDNAPTIAPPPLAPASPPPLAPVAPPPHAPASPRAPAPVTPPPLAAAIPGPPPLPAPVLSVPPPHAPVTVP